MIVITALLVAFPILLILVPSYIATRRRKFPKVDVPVLNLRSKEGGKLDYTAATEQYMYHFEDILQEGWQRFRDGIYQVWGIDGFLVIVSPKYAEEMNALGTDVLDVHAASQTRIIGEYEWLKIADHLLFHSVQIDLTRNTGNLIPGIRKEIEYVHSVHYPPCEEWTRIAPWPRLMETMALVVSYMTVGADLSRDEAWLSTMTGFLDDLFAGGWELKSYPIALRPLAARGLVPGIRRVWAHQARARSLLVPIIRARRAAEAAAALHTTHGAYEKPNDLLQWMADNSRRPGRQQQQPARSDEFVADMCLVVGFGALHATGTTLANAVLDLAAHPEYAKVIRDEYRGEVARGHEKASALVNSLGKLDSFLKESQRMNPTTLTAFSRQVLKPFTLSNGVHFPEGTHILVPSAMISRDPTVYPSPDKFDGLRFYNRRQAAAGGAAAHRNQFTSTSREQMHFGFGRQACPGRFFGAAAIKCVVLDLVERFDLRLVDEAAGRPRNSVKGAMISPDEKAELLFRRRGAGSSQR